MNEADIDDGLIYCDENHQGKITVSSSTLEHIEAEMYTPLSVESETLKTATFSQKGNRNGSPSSEEVETLHQNVRNVEIANYLKAANKQQDCILPMGLSKIIFPLMTWLI